MPGVYGFLEAERMQHRIGYLLKRPVGRPPNEVRRFYANFTYQAGSWTHPRRVIAKVEWHPGELYPRVGFLVSWCVPPKMSSLSTTNATLASSGSRRARARSNGRGCHAGRSPPTPSGSSFMRWPAISAISCARWRREADQDRCEGGLPRSLRPISDGRDRHPSADVPKDFAADCGTTAAATTSAA